MHYAIRTKVLSQTHIRYTQHKQSNFLKIFQFLWVFKFFNTLKNRTSKVRSTKSKNIKRREKQAQFSTHAGTITNSTQPIKVTKHRKY